MSAVFRIGKEEAALRHVKAAIQLLFARGDIIVVAYHRVCSVWNFKRFA